MVESPIHFLTQHGLGRILEDKIRDEAVCLSDSDSKSNHEISRRMEEICFTGTTGIEIVDTYDFTLDVSFHEDNRLHPSLICEIA